MTVRALFRLFLMTLMVGLVALPATPGTAQAQEFSDSQVKSIEKVIQEYLAKNPEVVLQAIRELQRRQQTAEKGRFLKLLAAHRGKLSQDPNSEIVGNAQGDVTVVEFFDYNCPYCKRVYPELTALIEKDSGVRLVLKEFPILGPGSELASRAAIASRKQGKYVEFHEALMETRGQLNGPRALQIAEDIGLDVAKLKKDMAAPEVGRIISANRQLAEILRINGTPAFVIGDALVSGYLSEDQLIGAVAKARAACTTC